MSYQYPLSLLIAHKPDRGEYLFRLWNAIQMYAGDRFEDIEVLIDDDMRITTGAKRNRLLQKASGKYVAFIDDDDMITEHYFPGVFAGIEKGVDCCSLRGIITDDGQNPRTFEHSLTHNRWETVQRGGKDYYLRFPNHLNCIKASIAKNISFPDQTVGEDHAWSVELHNSGMLRLEHWIEEPIYLYLHRSK